MKKILQVILAIIPAISFAGTTTGTVEAIYVHNYNDLFLVRFNSSVPDYAACATTNRYVVSTATQPGKNIMATILAAKAANQTVSIIGQNSCDLHGDAESVNWMYVH